jgi:hypothetical protein
MSHQRHCALYGQYYRFFKGTSVNDVLKIMGVSTEITELLLGTFNKHLYREATPLMTAKYPQKKLAKKYLSISRSTTERNGLLYNIHSLVQEHVNSEILT